MGRCIDAEYCEDFFDRWERRVKNADPVTIDVVQNTRTLLRDAPSIDIVWCKECKSYKKVTDKDGNSWETCSLHMIFTNADDFCSYGERREP